MSPCWAYEGETGCPHWGDIGYTVACSGREQSPVDINTSCCSHSGSSSLHVCQMASISGSIKNTGFTPKVHLREKTEHIEIEGEKYGLVQFHFHSPTEHTINGAYYPLELHLVHESMTRKGKLAVLAVLFEVGSHSEFIQSLLPIIPHGKNKSVNLTKTLSLEGLSIEPKYWQYKGSLTTPPCTEGVKWIILKKTSSLSREQLEKYLSLFPMETNRPLQALNNRVIQSVE